VERIKVGGGGRRRMLSCAALALVALSAASCTAASSSPPQKASGSFAIPSASSSNSAETPRPNAAPTPIPTIAPTFGPPGKFVPTGSMTVGRAAATATLLLDGRVLIAGDEGAVFAPGVPSLSPAGIKANDADRGRLSCTCRSQPRRGPPREAAHQPASGTPTAESAADGGRASLSLWLHRDYAMRPL
jgi:hypothetical protein